MTGGVTCPITVFFFFFFFGFFVCLLACRLRLRKFELHQSMHVQTFHTNTFQISVIDGHQHSDDRYLTSSVPTYVHTFDRYIINGPQEVNLPACHMPTAGSLRATVHPAEPSGSEYLPCSVNLSTSCKQIHTARTADTPHMFTSSPAPAVRSVLLWVRHLGWPKMSRRARGNAGNRELSRDYRVKDGPRDPNLNHFKRLETDRSEAP